MMMTMKTGERHDPDADLAAQLRRALELQKNGRIDEAEQAYRKVLKDYPAHPDALHIAALFFLKTEKISYASTLIKLLLVKRPEDFRAHAMAGQAAFKQGEYEAAMAHLQTSLSLQPAAETLALLGRCLQKTGKLPEAEKFYRACLQQIPDISALNGLAQVMLMQSRHEETINLLEEAIRKNAVNYDSFILLAVAHGPGTLAGLETSIKAMLFDASRHEARSLFAHSLSLGARLGSPGPDADKILALCLASDRVNHDTLNHFWRQQIFEIPAQEKSRALLEAKTYEDFAALYRQDEYKTALLQPLFLEGAEKINVFSPALENLLTWLRRHYLEKIAAGEISFASPEEHLLAALAIQSFFNEFLFNETAEETTQIAKLQQALESAEAPSACALAIYAAYKPLSSLTPQRDLAEHKNKFPLMMQKIIRIHIEEPEEEKQIRKKISKLGNITDRTSLDVQAQYEENPYPRWKSFNFLSPFYQGWIDEKYIIKGKALVAGCGTGKHAFHVNNQYPTMGITAVDLSTASLAYAARKTREYGLDHVRFLQADILELDKLKETFNIIECVGVLHHTRDPLKGLKILAGLLKPDGKIKLGFYSEHARSGAVVGAREIIAKEKFESTYDGIRQCRAFIKNIMEEKFRMLEEAPDFYSISAARDLMFHVHELRYTLPQIKEMLDTAGLEFTGFDMAEHQLAPYKQAFPDDKGGKNLENWTRFESENPLFFTGMYRFSARKMGSF